MRLARSALLAALSSLACSVSPTTEKLGDQRAAIVNGEPSGADRDSVVMIHTVVDDADLLCTATLVAPNLVITARHCVSYLGLGLFDCTVKGELIEADPGAGRLGQHLPAEGLEIYGRELPHVTPLAKGQQVLSTLTPIICTNDLAFVVLDRDVDLPIAPLRIGAPVVVHEPAMLVGFGLTGEQAVLEYRDAERRERAGVAIVGVGPDSVDDVTSIPPRSVILSGPSGCIGDSGGPLLSAETGAVLGIYSLLNAESCTEPKVKHHLVHVPAFEALISQAFEAAGHEPVLEGTSGSAGAAAGGAPAEAGAGGSENTGDAVGGNNGGEPPTEAEPPSNGDEPDSSCRYAPSKAPSSVCLAALLIAGVSLRRRAQRRPSSGSA